jgi:diaminopimelate decarboxylase
MTAKTVPFSAAELKRIAGRHPTPFHIYDEKAIRETARGLLRAFAWAPGFQEYFAVKACPNPHILKILGRRASAWTAAAARAAPAQKGHHRRGRHVHLQRHPARSTPGPGARAVINLTTSATSPSWPRRPGCPSTGLRYNPGPLREGNAIIGKPEEAKYGFTRQQLFEGYQVLRDRGVKRFGLHTMVASNELNPQYFVDTARMLYGLVAELSEKLDIRFEFINIGGGIGIPYRLEQTAVDIPAVSRGIEAAYNELIRARGLHPLRLYMEMGRMITGPHGFLVTRVLHLKNTYRKYIGVDACMANLMRPGMYGAYHHITVMGKEDRPADTLFDVTGSLCENNDKFAVQRPLPAVERGDLLVIHDTGAHGYAMGFNYNGKLRSAELLLQPDGSVRQIRRAETVEDYFATLDFKGL